ncbi:MAG: hypothetical protein IJY14_02730 [Acholeplasmatales bacterium]|nr:hypothetical protein [Acholeplasmatales bacterium]
MSILHKLNNNKWNILPYIIIIIASIMGTHFLFRDGICTGHDYAYHMPMILDDYYSLKNLKYEPISDILLSGIGIGKRLFYSPLPHLSVASLHLIMVNFGYEILDTYKMVVFLSVVISGLIMYRFSLKLTKNRYAALIGAIIYVIYPYRILDIFIRYAFAEVFSFIFLPLFFMGLYDFVHMDKNRAAVKPLLEILFGGAFLFLSHNLTAFYAFVFGFIYLLFNVKKIINMLKNKHIVAYTAITLICMIGIISVNLFTQLELMGMDFYNISIGDRMWTNIDYIEGRVGQFFQYSGFINLGSYITDLNLDSVAEINKYYEQILDYIKEAGFLVSIAIFYFILDNALKNKDKYLFLNHIIPICLFIVAINMAINTTEVLLGGYLLIIVHKASLLYKDDHISNNINKNLTFWYLCLSLILVFIMVSTLEIWKILPSVFLNIQFPWRLWAFFQLFISMLGAVLIAHFAKKRIIISSVAIAISLFLALNSALAVRRNQYENNYLFMKSDDSLFTYYFSIGSNKEYLPHMYHDKEKNYKSEYKNSLYKQVFEEVNLTKEREQYHIQPVVLDGDAQVYVSYIEVPLYELTINASNEALIQIPLIYYPGYEIIATNRDTKEEIQIDVEEIDGLISFKLNEGAYDISINYKGTSTRKFANAYFGVSVFGIVLLVCYNYHYQRKKDSEKEIKLI